MKHGALFAGINGFGLAARQVGIETAWYSEINDFCNQANRRNFPNATEYHDIRDIDGHQLEWCDIVSGGFPCQDISNAGWGAGLAGTRSSLWWDYWRIIRDMRPNYAILENSPKLADRGLDQILCALAEIGYDAVWESVRASDYAAPHLRERLYLIAYPHGLRREKIPNWPGCLAEITVEAAQGWNGEAGWHAPSLVGYEGWNTALAKFRGLDDGLPIKLAQAEFEAYGNAVVPHAPVQIFKAIAAVNQ